jgi:hypothetical protein
MRRLSFLAQAAVLGGTLSFGASASRAADLSYAITIDGRPLTDDPKASGGLYHAGVLYVDAIMMTKAFSGLLTIHDAGASLEITINRRTARFTRGRSSATLNGAPLPLAGAPFTYNGDLYVPLTAFGTLTRSKVSIDRGTRIGAVSTVSAPAAH